MHSRRFNKHFSPSELGKLISEDVNEPITEGVINFYKGPLTITTRRGVKIVANAVEDHGTWLAIAIGKPHKSRLGSMHHRLARKHPHLIKLDPWQQVPITDHYEMGEPDPVTGMRNYKRLDQPKQRVKNGRPCTRGLTSKTYPYGRLISILKHNVVSMEKGAHGSTERPVGPKPIWHNGDQTKQAPMGPDTGGMPPSGEQGTLPPEV